MTQKKESETLPNGQTLKTDRSYWPKSSRRAKALFDSFDDEDWVEFDIRVAETLIEDAPVLDVGVYENTDIQIDCFCWSIGGGQITLSANLAVELRQWLEDARHPSDRSKARDQLTKLHAEIASMLAMDSRRAQTDKQKT